MRPACPAEPSWRPRPAGAWSAIGSCRGWTGVLADLEVWLAHGINLREGLYG